MKGVERIYYRHGFSPYWYNKRDIEYMIEHDFHGLIRYVYSMSDAENVLLKQPKLRKDLIECNKENDDTNRENDRDEFIHLAEVKSMIISKVTKDTMIKLPLIACAAYGLFSMIRKIFRQ